MKDYVKIMIGAGIGIVDAFLIGGIIKSNKEINECLIRQEESERRTEELIKQAKQDFKEMNELTDEIVKREIQ